MPLYMYQATYSSESWSAQIQEPQQREEQARHIIEANGGKLHGFYYAFGEYDIVVILEFPDAATMAAVAMAIAANTGGVGKTTALMSASEGFEALKRASSVIYQAPGQSS